MPTVHLLCGLPGAGKTTVARRLERESRAVRFTLDEWMLSLFDLTPYDPEYGDRAERVKELIWRLSGTLLALGHDVVLDWSQWSRTARESACRRAESLGAEVLLHYVQAPMEVVVDRLARRNSDAEAGVHRIDLDDLDRFAAELFEPPTPDEGLETITEDLSSC